METEPTESKLGIVDCANNIVEAPVSLSLYQWYCDICSVDIKGKGEVVL